jgi:hypothetical protein
VVCFSEIFMSNIVSQVQNAFLKRINASPLLVEEKLKDLTRRPTSQDTNGVQRSHFRRPQITV